MKFASIAEREQARRSQNGKLTSTPSPLRGTPPVSGGELVTIGKRETITAPADCPPETGGRAKRRGWIKKGNGNRRRKREQKQNVF